MTFVSAMKPVVSQCNAVLCVITTASTILNINCWIPVSGMWGMKTSTAGEYHTQLFTYSCGILLKPVVISLYQLFMSGVWSSQLLQIKTCSTKSFMWERGSICSESFYLSKCQTSQHVRHVSEVFPIALGQTSSFKSENWKFDCGGPFNICCSRWSTGSDEACLEINFVVLVYF